MALSDQNYSTECLNNQMSVLDNVPIGTWNWSDTVQYYYNWYWPNYHVKLEKSKIDQAFKIIKHLMDKKLMDDNLTVRKFIDIVKEISDVL